MPLTASFSSTSSARSWTFITRRGASGLSTSEFGLGGAARLSRTPARRSGRSPTRASGRFAARRSISPTPRSWPGSLSTARSRARRRSDWRGRSIRWRKLREEIFEEVCAKGFDQELGSFVQSFGSKHLDASLLLIPCVGFLPVSDPRMEGTVTAIERRLLRDGFVMRYDTQATDDGLPPGEGAFLPCSFWLADVYIAAGPRRRCRADVPAAHGAAQRRRIAERRIRSAASSAWSAIFRKPSRTWRWSYSAYNLTAR